MQSGQQRHLGLSFSRLAPFWSRSCVGAFTFSLDQGGNGQARAQDRQDVEALGTKLGQKHQMFPEASAQSTKQECAEPSRVFQVNLTEAPGQTDCIRRQGAGSSRKTPPRGSIFFAELRLPLRPLMVLPGRWLGLEKVFFCSVFPSCESLYKGFLTRSHTSKL